MIELKNISKSYFVNENISTDKKSVNEISILKNLNLKVNSAEVVAIIGSSGSGKSTLLSLLSGLDKIDQGEMWIKEQPIHQLSLAQLTQFRAENIGIVFQNFHLVNHLTAFENLTLPLDILSKNYSHEKINQALDSVGLLHRAQNKPTQLSGGECQRLALARALIVDPLLVLADEPSGSLDHETGEKVMSIFFEQVRKQQSTVILVTHDLELAKKCDSIYKLNHGVLTRV